MYPILLNYNNYHIYLIYFTHLFNRLSNFLNYSILPKFYPIYPSYFIYRQIPKCQLTFEFKPQVKENLKMTMSDLYLSTCDVMYDVTC